MVCSLLEGAGPPNGRIRFLTKLFALTLSVEGGNTSRPTWADGTRRTIGARITDDLLEVVAGFLANKEADPEVQLAADVHKADFSRSDMGIARETRSEPKKIVYVMAFVVRGGTNADGTVDTAGATIRKLAESMERDGLGFTVSTASVGTFHRLAKVVEAEGGDEAVLSLTGEGGWERMRSYYKAAQGGDTRPSAGGHMYAIMRTASS